MRKEAVVLPSASGRSVSCPIKLGMSVDYAAGAVDLSKVKVWS
jgi:hypothetical protein